MDIKRKEEITPITNEPIEKKKETIMTEYHEETEGPRLRYILEEPESKYSNVMTPKTIEMNFWPIEKRQTKSYNPTYNYDSTEAEGTKDIFVVDPYNTSGKKQEGMYLFGKGAKSLSKIDAYKPKYLEMLELNTNRYELLFRNLDLYSTTGIDQTFDNMAKIRIVELRELAKNNSRREQLIAVVQDCRYKYNPLTKKKGRYCVRYLSPIYREDNRLLLLKKLEPRISGNKDLSRAKHEIVVNNFHITVDDLITKEEYEIAEGAKIQSWIENNLIYYGGYNTSYFGYMMFSDLLYLQDKGHIYLARAGIRRKNLLTPNLIELKHFKNHYGKPIDVSQLMFQLQTSKNSASVMNETANEANKIMSQEYFICLQPQPRYMLYILKRLIISWYADIDLIENITKIRLLINQYRARRDKKENLEWGVLPSILIYIRYGLGPFNRVLSKINYFFTNLVHTGWTDNEPDYFTKYNDLIYYSNGSPDAKRFFDHLSVTGIYDTKNINPTAFFKYGKDVVTPYPQPYTKNNMEPLKYHSKFKLELIKDESGRVDIPPGAESEQVGFDLGTEGVELNLD